MRCLKKPALLLILLCVCVVISYSRNFGYQNPILPGMNPDPSICRVGDDYYLVTSSFVQYPGLPVYHSKDLIHWDIIGYCCREENGFDVSRGSGLYAPTIRFNEKDSTFYVICTNVRNGGNFITYTRNPRGTWSRLNYLQHKDMHGIDPSLMFDTEGKCYFTATHKDGIIQAEIDPKTGRNITSPLLIWGGTGGRYPEGPHLYHIGPWYYLIISEGGTEFGHHVVASRSNNPWGPFETCPYNPILSHVEKIAQSNPIQCTGHSDLIQAHDGSWWAVFLATRPNGQAYHLGRETFLSPVTWTRDNWPVFNGNGTVDLQMNVPTLLQTEAKSRSKRYDFDMPVLPLEWNFYRHPAPGAYYLEQGSLVLRPIEGNTAFTGIRQEGFDVYVETCLDVSHDLTQGEAGLSVRRGDNQCYNISIIREKGRAYVASRFKFGHADCQRKEPVSLKGKIYLRIEGNKKYYVMKYSIDAQEWHSLGAMDTSFLAGGFSGVLIGLFAATGDSGECEAKFDYFDYGILD